MSGATEIAFYHLVKWPLEHALPKLLERILSQDFKAVVRVASDSQLSTLNQALWTYDPGSFLPHGVAGDGNVKQQPIYLTTGSEVPNDATVLILTGDLDAHDINRFARCVDIFDGTDEALSKARKRWESRSTAGYSQTYWQQTSDGRWERPVGY